MDCVMKLKGQKTRSGVESIFLSAVGSPQTKDGFTLRTLRLCGETAVLHE
jgi:hypothetical protein